MMVDSISELGAGNALEVIHYPIIFIIIGIISILIAMKFNKKTKRE
jgi:hypothetical protein